MPKNSFQFHSGPTNVCRVLFGGDCHLVNISRLFVISLPFWWVDKLMLIDKVQMSIVTCNTQPVSTLTRKPTLLKRGTSSKLQWKISVINLLRDIVKDRNKSMYLPLSKIDSLSSAEVAFSTAYISPHSKVKTLASLTSSLKCFLLTRRGLNT